MLENTPFFEDDYIDGDLWFKLQKLREVIISRNEDNCHELNNKNVTGLWYLTDLSYDGCPQLIIRSPISIESTERLLLHTEIFNIIEQDTVYDYDKDIISGQQMIAGEQNELLKEIAEGRVLMIYDAEREA